MFPGGFPGAYGNPYGYPPMNDGYATFDGGGTAQNDAWQQEQPQQMNAMYGMYNPQWQPVEQYDPNIPGRNAYPYGGTRDGATNEVGENGEGNMRLEDMDEAQLQALPIEQLRRLDQQHVRSTAAGLPPKPPPSIHNQRPQPGSNTKSKNTATSARTNSNTHNLEKAVVDKTPADRAAELRAKLIAARERSNTPNNRNSANAAHTTGKTVRSASLISPMSPGEADDFGPNQALRSAPLESPRSPPSQGLMMADALDGLITEGKAAAHAMAKRSSLGSNAANVGNRKATDGQTEKSGTSKAEVITKSLPEKPVQKTNEPVKSVFKDNRQDSLPKNTPLSGRHSRLSGGSLESGEIEDPPPPKPGLGELRSNHPVAKDRGQALASTSNSRPISAGTPNNAENNKADYTRGSKASRDFSKQREHEKNGGGRELGNNKTGQGSFSNRPPPAKQRPREPYALPEKHSSEAHPNKTTDQDGKKSTPASISAHQNLRESREADRPSFNTPPEDTAVRSEHNPEVADWLELTGYYNLDYREQKLNNYRRQQEIHRLQQELEEEEEKIEMIHKPTLRASSVRPPGLMSRAESAAAMPPPPRPAISAKSKDFVLSPDGMYDEDDRRAASSLKRASSPPDGPRNGTLYAKKMMRLDTLGGAENPYPANDRETQSSLRESAPNSATSRREDDGPFGLRVKGAVDDDRIRRPSTAVKDEPRSRATSPLPLSERISKPDGPRPRQYRPITDRSPRSHYGAEDDRARYLRPRSASPGGYASRSSWHDRDGHSYDYSRSDWYDGNAYSDRRSSHDRGHYNRGRGSDRGDRGDRGGRGGYRGVGNQKRGAITESTGSSSLNLRAGDTRYFMIKSWNHENVQIAQQESVWATQTRNEGVLTEAYKTCRQVILLFSVNKSMAFQGYALMASPPGSAPLPVWATNLNWPTSGAFEIRWIAISDTPFRRVGHLKNCLNEGLAVPVGRDGQEIEEEAGRQVCEIVDEVVMEWY